MKRRYLAGVVAATVVGAAIVLLGPDSRKALLEGSPYGDLVERDLDVIRKDTLRVLVIQHHLTYERTRGVETGLEYELLERIAKDIGVPIKAVVVERSDSLLPMLQRGQGDVIAAQMARKNRFARWMLASLPYRHVAPVFVTLRPDHVLGVNLGNRIAPDTAWVSAWSPFAPSALRFPGNDGPADRKGRTVFTDTSTFGDNVVINVALGRMRAAIVSDAVAVRFARIFPQLAFSAPYESPVPLVFGMRSNARMLQRAIDQRLNDPKEKEAMAMLMSAYGDHLPEREPLGAAQCVASGQGLPGYSPRAHRNAGDHDWELLAAIAFQGARADSAVLLASLSEETGETYTMPTEDPRLAAAQIRAAAHYIAELDSLWEQQVPDADERLRFTAAAYCVGPGHVRDACVLAQRLQLDPQRWEGQVERAITLLALPRFFSAPGVKNGPCRGDETFMRVREVICLYKQFHGPTR